MKTPKDKLIEKVAKYLHDSEFAILLHERDGFLQEEYIQQAEGLIDLLNIEVIDNNYKGKDGDLALYSYKDGVKEVCSVHELEKDELGKYWEFIQVNNKPVINIDSL